MFPRGFRPPVEGVEAHLDLLADDRGLGFEGGAAKSEGAILGDTASRGLEEETGSLLDLAHLNLPSDKSPAGGHRGYLVPSCRSPSEPWAPTARHSTAATPSHQVPVKQRQEPQAFAAPGLPAPLAVLLGIQCPSSHPDVPARHGPALPQND